MGGSGVTPTHIHTCVQSHGLTCSHSSITYTDTHRFTHTQILRLTHQVHEHTHTHLQADRSHFMLTCTLTGLGRYSHMLVLMHMRTQTHPHPENCMLRRAGATARTPPGQGHHGQGPEASGHSGFCLQSCQVPSAQLPDKRHPLPTTPPSRKAGELVGDQRGLRQCSRPPGRLPSRQTALNHHASRACRSPPDPRPRSPLGRGCAHTLTFTQLHTRGLTHTHSMHTNTHRHPLITTHTDSNTQSHTHNTHSLTHTQTHIDTHIHSHTHNHIHTIQSNTHKHSASHTHCHTLITTHTYTHSLSHTHKHTHGLTHTHSNAH